MASLILKIDSRVTKFSIPGVAVIGRDKDCTISIDDKQASRKHTRIFFDGRGFFVEDLGSRNGTFVNGVRIGQRTPLKPGDVLRIGVHTFTFSDDRPEAVPAKPQPQPERKLEIRKPASPQGGSDAPMAMMKAFLFILCVLIFGATAFLSRTLFGWVLKLF